MDRQGKHLSATASLGIAFVVLLALFLMDGANIQSDWLTSTDLSATRELQSVSSPTLTSGMWDLTFSGNTLTLVILDGLVLIACLALRHIREAIFCFVSGLALNVNDLLKPIWGRPRPTSNLVHVLTHPGGFSFPSGHAMGSTITYGFFAFLAWQLIEPSKWRTLLLAILLAWPVLICSSRMYLGVHWLSDVVGGILAGAMVVIALAFAYEVTTPPPPVR